MRIVHDIDSEAQVSGGNEHTYAVAKDKPGPSKGFRCSVLITSKSPFGEEEAIHIHGDAKHMRTAFLEAAMVVEVMAEAHVKAGDLDPAWDGEPQATLEVVEEGKDIIHITRRSIRDHERQRTSILASDACDFQDELELDRAEHIANDYLATGEFTVGPLDEAALLARAFLRLKHLVTR